MNTTLVAVLNYDVKFYATNTVEQIDAQSESSLVKSITAVYVILQNSNMWY